MKREKLNKFYGIGTLGRDMVYAMSAMYLMYYLTDVKGVSVKGLGIITVVMVLLRIFDALNDPVMGYLIDNTKSRFGKFKPWIFGGSIVSAVMTILLFFNPTNNETVYLIYFTIVYLLWGLAYTAHDISYWSMLPSLSKNQNAKEKIGSIAKICADIGIFSVVIGIVPITQMLSKALNGMQNAYFCLSITVSIIMIFCLGIMLLVVKENRDERSIQKSAGLKDIIQTIFKNDQLLWVVLAMVLFTIANTTTTSLGIYYFQYIFGNQDFYSVFAGILGVSQLLALISFPYLSSKFGRRWLYGFGTILVCIGYICFYFSESIIFVSLSGVIIFFGEGFIQILMLMFISDCVEYGEWKLGRRNDSITLSLQPFVAKMGSAIASGIVGITIILSNIKNSSGPQDLSVLHVHIFKTSMLIIPLIIIVFGYFIYRKYYKLDDIMYKKIVEDLETKKSKSI